MAPSTAKLETSTISEEVPDSFNVTLNKNIENTPYDSKELLSLIQKRYQKQAQRLLEILLKSPNSLSWNLSGTVFIDSVAIPNTNFYLIFNALYKRRNSNLNGLNDVLVKLNEMGLSNFILLKNSNLPENISNDSLIESSEKVLPALEKDNQIQWWYIGD